jgi:hypothetical protein
MAKRFEAIKHAWLIALTIDLEYFRIMARRTNDSTLTTTRQVIAALGGVSAVCELTGAAYTAVHNWLGAPHFPARYFLVMLAALKRRGKTARPELWGMVVSANRERRAS